MLKLTNAGELAALAAFVGKSPAGDMGLHLYTNNLVLSEVMTQDSFIEPTFVGYNPALLTGSVWSVQSGNPAAAEYVEQTFFCNISPPSPQTVYGYYVTRAVSGDVLWAEKFPIPQIISATGESIGVAPRLTARDETD